MTHKEVMKDAVHRCNECAYNFDATRGDSEVCEKCAIAFAYNQAPKVDKYRWHDLREDLTDLPEDGETVIVTLNGKTDLYDLFVVGVGEIDGLGLMFGCYFKDEIVAWKRIEPLEVEE